MIPSSPRRTWLFLLFTGLAFFGPDLLVPAPWANDPVYMFVSTCYQAALVLAGFTFGTAICRALVVHEVTSGPLRIAVNQVLHELERARIWAPRVVIADHSVPFVLTAGLLPNKCQIFVSSVLLKRLSQAGMCFLIARATAHTAWYQRLAALLPVLAITVLIPDVPHSLSAWLTMGAFLLLWLMLHWIAELTADRQTARMIGNNTAVDGMHNVQTATTTHMTWLTLSPPLSWRLRAANST